MNPSKKEDHHVSSNRHGGIKSKDISKKKAQGNLKAKLVLTQNKNIFSPFKKTLIFEEKVEEQSDLLNEDNIKDNLDN